MTTHMVIKFSAVNMLLIDDDSRTPQAISTKRNSSIQLDVLYYEHYAIAQKFIHLKKKNR